MNIKCVHLLSRPLDDREKRSRAEVDALKQHGISVTEVVNEPFTGTPPESRLCNDRPFLLTPGMYGCWSAHKDAITRFLDNVDALLVCECDCLFNQPPDETVFMIELALRACNEGNLAAFTFGYTHAATILDRIGEDVIVINRWIETHCYLVPIKSRQIFLDMFAQPWDAYDYCTTIYLCDRQKLRIGAFADRPAAIQGNGPSLLADVVRKSENHYRNAKQG